MNIKINGRNFDKFNKISIELKYDAIGSTFDMLVYFNPENEKTKELFKPFSYNNIIIEHDKKLLLTGVIISHSNKKNNRKELLHISGYSLPGILEDCEIPTSLYPLQSDGKTLKEITERLIAKFGLELIVDKDVESIVNKKYSQSTADQKQSIKSYINELASQRNVTLSHDVQGRLVFTKAKTKMTPIALFTENKPVISIESDYNGQGMHSHITVVKQAEIEGNNATEYTIENPYVKIYKPTVIEQSSGSTNDVADAAKNLLSSELKNIKINISLNTWTISGKIIQPNNIIEVTSPENFIYKKTKFFIESVTLSGDETSTTSSLTCVLPEVYNQETPINIFE